MSLTIPNLADAGFPDQAAPDSGDFAALVAGFNGYTVTSGCEVTPGVGLSVNVVAGTATFGSDVSASVVAVTGVALALAPPANPRYDLVTVTPGGVVVITGVASDTPSFPHFPSTSVLLAAIWVPPNTNSLTSAHIVDKRVVSTPAPTALNTTFTFGAALSTYSDLVQHTGFVSTVNGWPVNGLLIGFRSGVAGTQWLQSDSSDATYTRHWISASSMWSAFTPQSGSSTSYAAKGGLQIGVAPNAATELPVGANGQYLIADSAQFAGVRWGVTAITMQQAVAAAQWNFIHSFPYRPDVEVFDQNGESVEPDVSFPTASTVRITFGFPMTGSIRLL